VYILSEGVGDWMKVFETERRCWRCCWVRALAEVCWWMMRIITSRLAGPVVYISVGTLPR
jgi:hypothetical protein